MEKRVRYGRSASQLTPTEFDEVAYALGVLPTDGRSMIIVVSVIHLDLISSDHDSFSNTYLLLIDIDMIVTMSVIMSMSMSVSVMMMAARCVHPE